MNIFKKLKNRWEFAKEQTYINQVLKLVDKEEDGTIKGDMRDAYMDYYILTGDTRALIDALELRRPGRNTNPNDGASVYVHPALLRSILVSSFVRNREDAKRILYPEYRVFEDMTIDLIKDAASKKVKEILHKTKPAR